MQTQTANQVALDRQYERVAWGLFLIMIGGLALVPDQYVPGGAWLAGTGLILLGLNLMRYYSQLPVRTFTVVLGIIALLAGLADFVSVDLPLFPIILITIGASILLRNFQRV